MTLRAPTRRGASSRNFLEQRGVAEGCPCNLGDPLDGIVRMRLRRAAWMRVGACHGWPAHYAAREH